MTPPVFGVPVGGLDVGDSVVVSGEEGHHAADVRRLHAGEPVALTDGAGVLVEGRVAAARRGEITVEVLARREVPRPAPRLAVVQALARGGRDEQAVETMTEIGVDEVLGWPAARSIAKWTDRTRSRWEATVRAAAKQSRRAWWPVVDGPVTTADVVARCRAAERAFVLHEAGTRRWEAADVPAAGEVVVVVGPEGGLTDDELDVLREAGGLVVRLGDSVLRSSTAGAAALSAICAATRWR